MLIIGELCVCWEMRGLCVCMCVWRVIWELSVLSTQFFSKPKIFFTNIYFSGECIGHWVILLTLPLHSNNYRELKQSQQQNTDATRSHLQICQSLGSSRVVHIRIIVKEGERENSEYLRKYWYIIPSLLRGNDLHFTLLNFNSSNIFAVFCSFQHTFTFTITIIDR